MAQTALQELIEWVVIELKLEGYEHQEILEKIESLLPKERQIIEDAYSDGKYHSTQGTITEIDMTASDYFTQNFNQ